MVNLRKVIFCQIKTRKGHRAINVKKLSGAAQGKKRRAFQPNPGRRLVLKGIRPAVEIRRETPPSFLSNFDVPDFIERAIRQGQDLLREMPELAENLTFQNYQAKIDALLYCEEVDAAMELDRVV